QSDRVYRDALNEVTSELLVGNVTVDQAIRKSINQMSQYGIPALIDKAGRRWSPEGYIRTVLVTTSSNVANAMQDSRIREWGVDLIEVSSHAGARPLCAPYQGRIYSLSGRHPRYPSIESTSYGQA